MVRLAGFDVVGGRQQQGRPDWKRVLALAAVLTLHLLVLAAMLLPRQAPYTERPLPPLDSSPISLIETLPLPPPPQPVPPPPLPIQPFVAPTAAPAPISLPSDPAPAIVEEAGEPLLARSDAATDTAPAGLPLDVTGALSAPVLFALRPIHAPPPAYPVAAIRKRQQGLVELRVLVSAAGLPERMEIERSSGHHLLDRAALHGVRRWRFEPHRVDGQAVPAWALVPIHFRLDR